MKRKLYGPSADLPDTRYVTVRKNRNGKLRRYWIRKGHEHERLPDGPAWTLRADALNKAADKPGARVMDGSIAWAINEYRMSDAYKALSASSIKVYERWLKQFEAEWGRLHCRDISRKVVKAFAQRYQHKKPTRMQAVAVLQNILGIAYDENYIPVNPASKMKLRKNPPRQQVWETADIDKWMAEAEKHPHAVPVKRYFWLLLYTGQRPVDCVRMTKSRYNGDTIKLVQQKTKKLMEVPCHMELKATMATDPFPNSLYLIAQPDGKPFGRGHLSEVFGEIRTLAGLGRLQARDLRRTAVVRMAEAGCSVPQISAITGHSIDETNRIMETYLPRTLPMARNAITKWEQNKPTV